MARDRREAALLAWSRHRDKYEAAVAKLRGSRPLRFCECCRIQLTTRYRVRFCSRSCAAKTCNEARGLKSRPIANCENCGGEFRKCRGQVCCTQRCHVEMTRRNKIQSWLSGASLGATPGWGIHSYVRDWVIARDGGRCTICGWADINPATGRSPLNVDHTDGDSTNNRPENLRTLCPNCHSLTPTYGSLNRGRGRKGRYKK